MVVTHRNSKLHYFVRHSDRNVLLRLQHPLRGTGSATPNAPVHAYRPRTVGTPSKTNATIAAAARQL